jgi:hypothetical protein
VFTALHYHSQEVPWPLPSQSTWWTKRIVESRKALGYRIRVGGKGPVAFLEFGFDDLRDCRDIEVIVGGMVGDVPRGIEDIAEDFGLETLDALDVGWLIEFICES